MKQIVYPILIVIIAAFLRIAPHPPNVAPIAAMALFGGVYMDKKYALAIPLLALFASDLVLGFYSGMVFVYGSFLLTGCIGLWVKKYKSIGSIVAASLLCSCLFYLITNFGVWLQSGMYSHTYQGLLQSYYRALPFFRNTLIGDFLYVGLLCGGYEVVMRFIHQKKLRSAA